MAPPAQRPRQLQKPAADDSKPGLLDFEALIRRLALELESRSLQHTLTAGLHQLVGCESAVLAILRAETSEFVPASPENHPDAIRFLAFTAGGRLARWLRVNDEALPIPDDRGVFEYLAPEERLTLQHANVRLCLPLCVAGRLVGILLAVNQVPMLLSTDALSTLETYARHGGLAWERVSRLEEERERTRAAVRNRDLALAGQLAAAVAHEIRNPLAAIRSSVQYVAESPDAGPEREAFLSRVLDDIDRINRTLSNLLGLTRPQANTLSSVDIAELVDHALSLMEAYLHHHRVIVRREVEPRLYIEGDAVELRQVLLNVLLNACQAMPTGGALAIATQQRGTDVVLSISDSGIGISPEIAERAFEPFFSTKSNGTGLGLAICKDIVMRHRGSIQLHGAPGQGTTVSLTLPLLR